MSKFTEKARSAAKLAGRIATTPVLSPLDIAVTAATAAVSAPAAITLGAVYVSALALGPTLKARWDARNVVSGVQLRMRRHS